MSAAETAEMFFRTYERALLDRDPEAIADHYAVPALIAFPDQLNAVTDAEQTRAFFAGAFQQYEGVTEARHDIVIAASSNVSVWADVTWTYDGAPPERNMYQLVRMGERWRIAVLTPLPVAA